ncbi:MAG: hypothetical protein P4M01_08840 [Acidobacteriota bacterium]|nr:hypothetical protein [Acidobacteriota bacterium]
MKRKTLILVLAMLSTLPLLAQSTAAEPPLSARGYYFNFATIGAHDSAAGYSMQIIPAIGRDFQGRFTVELGAPFYPLAGSHVTSSTTVRGVTTTTTSNVTAVWGDMYAVFYGNFKAGPARYKLTLKGTAPTGDTASGISTGRATWNWANHLEVGKNIAAYVDFGLANTLADSTQYHRSYTTLGYVVPMAAGLNIPLGKRLALDASSYYDLPFGDQKLYSRTVSRNSALPVGTRLGGGERLNQYLLQGGASLTEDHGYTGSVSYQATRRVGLEVSYNRSIPYALDTVTAALSVRLGHSAEEKPGQ